MSKKNKQKPNTTSRFTASKEAPKQEVLVPAKLVKDQRDQSHYIIDTLSKTALTLAGGENAGDKVAVIERLWAMQKDAEDRQAEREFGIAKVAVAMALPEIPKTRSISFVDKNNQKRETPYADRNDIESVLDPICRQHGFSKEYSTDTIDGKAAQVLTVRHVSGHTVVYKSPYMPLDTTGSKNNNQAAGSTAEYGKRYALCGAFNIRGVDKDDDGNNGKNADAKHEDKFAARAAADAKPVEEQKPDNVLAAGETLRDAIKAAPVGTRRGEILMKNVKLIGALEEAGHTALVDEIRKLAEEVANA